MDSDTRSRYGQSYFEIVAPEWWRSEVNVDLGDTAVLVDPYVVVHTPAEHIAVEVSISLELGSSTARVLPDHHVIVIILLFQEDVVSATRPENTSKLDALLYTSLSLTIVRLAGRPPCGNLVNEFYQSVSQHSTRRTRRTMPLPTPLWLIQVWTFPKSLMYM
jgi:hypothetical protein